MPFEFENTYLEGLVLVKPRVFDDGRGFFLETYRSSYFRQAGITCDFTQDNHSGSEGKGTLRGLHYQSEPMAQGKLVRVTRGRAFDVAVDIRPASPTFGKWYSVVLSADDRTMLYVPEGFAHGFCTLEDDTEVMYKCTREYSPEHERGIMWNDPALGIEWPVKEPVLSERDAKWPALEVVRKGQGEGI